VGAVLKAVVPNREAAVVVATLFLLIHLTF
jgi:hypothetical protein